MATSYKLTMTSYGANCDGISFFRFTVNLEQFGSRISDARSVKLTFSLIVNFYLTKTGNRTKKPLTQLFVLQGIFSETIYGCVLTHQISSFQHNSNEFRQEIICAQTAKRTPEKPTQIRITWFTCYLIYYQKK